VEVRQSQIKIGPASARRNADPIGVQINQNLVAVFATQQDRRAMSLLLRLSAAMCAAVLMLTPVAALAQSGEAKPGDKPPQAATEPSKDTLREEFADAARQVNGPAGNPECVWLGRRVVGLLWRDDLDTAFRHLDLYDRFGCPGPHVQATFRCVVRQGNIDTKAPESLSARVHACWLNPAVPTPPTTSAANPAPAGTTTK
jgi:hypothetical protein